jgi:hypothetical protein
MAPPGRVLEQQELAGSDLSHVAVARRYLERAFDAERELAGGCRVWLLATPAFVAGDDRDRGRVAERGQMRRCGGRREVLELEGSFDVLEMRFPTWPAYRRR